MKLKELFKQNPFQNLIVAGESTADFPLRGHEDLFENKIRQISDAIENPDYPANAQHTIVFGEWGHGKTHVLRTIEYRINSKFPQRAKAVFFEPTELDPQDIFQELCRQLKIEADGLSEFIENVQKNFPENLFLLIDETQSVVGEKLSENYESQLRSYWTLLSELQQAASDKLYGLHIFHGLSANSASAINRVGQIPAIKKFTRHIFSLKSLDEEAQWRMLCDHIQRGLAHQEIRPDVLVNRGVSRCINELTGGSPRFALALMAQIFGKAQSQGLDNIDGPICYQTLSETQRLDATGQNYFDRFAIRDLLAQLKDGQQFEQRIGEMLHQRIGSILGEWSGIDQAALAQYGLTTANIRRRCDSLKEPVVIFDQPLGQTHFRLSNDFLRLIRLRTLNTLTKNEDKDLLLRLQLEPESLVPSMIIGIQKVMAHNGFFGGPQELMTTAPFRIFLASLGGTHLAENIRVGLAVFKGDQIPLDVFEKIVGEIEADRCTIMIIIEDANTRHDRPSSTYAAFKSSYNGSIDVEKRIIFINGTDPDGQRFDEDFFVRLVKTDINQNEAKDWFDRLQISRRLKRIEEDCIYCPDLNEQMLLEELFKQDRSFKIGDMKDLNDNFDWVSRERLARLELYLSKTGGSYTTPVIDQVMPFKFILGKLQESGAGLTAAEIERQISAKYIRTGAPAAIQAYVKWVLRLLIERSKVREEDGRFLFKDLERELMQLETTYDQAFQSVERGISQYTLAEIEEPALDDIREKTDDISKRIGAFRLESKTEVKIAEFQNALNGLKKLGNELVKIPEKARESLRGQLNETHTKYEIVKQCAFWPVEETPNPYERLYGLDAIYNRLERLGMKILEEIPFQRSCRQEIKAINDRLDGLGSLLEGEIKSGTYEGQEVDECIFKICNAIRVGKSGKVTLHFS